MRFAGSMLVVLTLGVGLLAAVVGSAATRSAPDQAAGQVIFTRITGGSRGRQSQSLYLVKPGARPRLFVKNASEGAVSPDGRRIAFVRAGAIWVMNRDGSRQRQVTRPARPKWGVTADDAPAWSADGRRLLFSRPPLPSTDASSIYAVSLGGGQLRRLTPAKPEECYWRPAPSPDSRTVAYDVDRDCPHGNSTSIDAVTMDGQQTNVLDSLKFPDPGAVPGPTTAPAWDPTGRFLAYAVQDSNTWAQGPRRGGSGIYLSSFDGSPPHLIPVPASATLTESMDWPNWSRDGSWIAFVGHVTRRYDSPGDIWVARADGTTARRITRGNADDRYPAWLPQATTIQESVRAGHGRLVQG